MARKIIYVSLGCIFRSHGRNGNEFNHLGVLAPPQTLRISVFKSPKIQNSPENHETWHGVTKWHIYIMVKKLSNLVQDILQASYKPKLLAILVVPVGKHAPLVGETIIVASSPLVFYFLQARYNNRSVVLKFETVQGSFGHFIY